jgi:hypothetical protein
MDWTRFWFVILVIVIAVLIFFIFGYYGFMETKRIGATCDIGFSNFCWKWTKEIILQSG